MELNRTAACKTVALCASTALLITACQAPVDVDADVVSQDSSSEIQTNPAAVEKLPEAVQETGALTFAGVEGMPPMMYVLQDGTTLDGFEHDILDAVGQSLGVEVKMVGTKPESFLTGLLADRFKAAAGSITATPQRQEQVDFVTYAQFGVALLTRKEDVDEVTFDNLCGRTIGVLQGSIQQVTQLPELSEECESDGEPSVKESALPDGNDMVLALTSDRIDGVLLNEITLQDMANKSNGELVVSDASEKLGEDLKGIAVQKDSDLASAIAEAVTGMYEDGTLQQIFERWGLSDEVVVAPQINPAGTERGSE